jgi:hypothetical protein
VGLTYGGQIKFDGDEPPQHLPRWDKGNCWRIMQGLELIESCCRTGSNPVTTPTVVVRCAWQKRLGGYRAELPHTADLELWLRFAGSGRVGVIEALQAYKRVHARNMQVQYVTTRLGDLHQRKAAFDVWFQNGGGRIAGADDLRRQADRSLAAEAFWAASAAFDQRHVGICNELLDLALSLDPELRARPHWARLRWKRRLGPTIWRALRPLVSG